MKLLRTNRLTIPKIHLYSFATVLCLHIHFREGFVEAVAISFVENLAKNKEPNLILQQKGISVLDS
jgi:hypothetical protein